MPADIIDFPTPTPKNTAEVTNTDSGQAKCLNCGHEWYAIAPSGTEFLECPSCHHDKGFFRYPYVPVSHTVWRCQCGNDLFYITPEGHFCPKCGTVQTY